MIHPFFNCTTATRLAKCFPWLAAFALHLCDTFPSAADGKPPASNQGRETAERAVTQLRAKCDDLTARLQATERELQGVAERLGLPSDPRIVALIDRIQKATARAKTLQATFKKINPGTFNTLAEMEEHDRLMDQHKAMAYQAKQLEAERQVAARVPRSAAATRASRSPRSGVG